MSNAGTVTTTSDTDYNRKIYVNLGSVGVGTHTFKHPDIDVKIEGKVSVGTTTVIPDYYKFIGLIICYYGKSEYCEVKAIRRVLFCKKTWDLYDFVYNSFNFLLYFYKKNNCKIFIFRSRYLLYSYDSFFISEFN